MTNIQTRIVRQERRREREKEEKEGGKNEGMKVEIKQSIEPNPEIRLIEELPDRGF